MNIIEIIVGLVAGMVIMYVLTLLLTPKGDATDTSSLKKELLEKEESIHKSEINYAKLESNLDSISLQKNKADTSISELNNKLSLITASEASLKTQVENLTNTSVSLQEEKVALTQQRDTLLNEKSNLTSQVSSLTEINKNLKEQQKEVADIEKRFNTEFENISARLIKENTKSLNEKSSESLANILNPLKDNLESFRKNIDDKYIKEAEAKASLKTEIQSLIKLNEQLSDDAHNLTKALTGNNKHQGNWGEIVLERVLERSGLNKGQEYKLQEHITTEDGSRRIPDAVVFLPDNKHIIIDSKVSLTAYQRMVNADTIEEQNQEIKQHVISLKAHIKELGDKSYYDTEEYNSPDFTLMFLPIEASFSVALREDTELFNYAWERNIIIVSPTTLLATLRTIESTWKHERQTRNVLEIARVGGTLYDKFYGFIEDLQKIEKGIKSSQSAYDEAFKKLSSGRGNMIGQTEKLKSLGAKAKKSLSSDLIDEANEFIIENSTNE